MPGLVVLAILTGAVGVGLWYLGVRARRRTRRLVTTETLDAATLLALVGAAADSAGPGAFDQPVELSGPAMSGPNGTLRSPLTGTECLWHRHQITRRERRNTTDQDGKAVTETVNTVIASGRSEEPFAIGDPAILVRASTGVDAARKSLDELREPDRRSLDGAEILGLLHEEWVLGVGQQLFVQGRATDAGGRLSIVDPPGSGALLISTRTEAELTTAAESSARRFRTAALVAIAVAAALLLWAVVR